MNKAEAFPSRFWKAEDVKSQPAVVTIAFLTTERIGQDRQEKHVLNFEDCQKQLVVNATNFDAIAEITGEADSDCWAGHRIMLVPARVDFGGRKVDAIRVSAAASKPGAPAKRPQPPPVESEDEYFR